MSENAVAKDRSSWLKWSSVILLPVAVFLGCRMAGLPEKHVLFYAITSAALTIWALGLLSDTIVAVVLPILYIVLELGKPGQILGPWSSSVGWVVFGGLIFANIMMRTGFANRLAVWALYITRGSFTRLLWGILLAGFLIGPCIPSIMGKAALISVICIGICEAMKLEKQSVAASCVMLAGFISIAASKFAFLTGGADVTMYMGLMTDKMGITVSWGQYFLHNAPLAVIYGIYSIAVLILVLRPKIEMNLTEYVNTAHAGLGPMSGDERKTALLIGALIVLLLTDRYHGIDTGWIMILLSFIAFLPGIRLIDDKKLQKISFTSVFFVVGCMSIGSAAKALGADKALADSIAPLMQGSSDISAMLLGYFAGTALNFLLTPLAAFSSMTVPLTELIMSMGINPMPVMYSFAYGLDQYIFPYEFAVLLFFYATGWIALRHILLVFAVRFAATLVFLLAVAYPWWRLLGLFEFPVM